VNEGEAVRRSRGGERMRILGGNTQHKTSQSMARRRSGSPEAAIRMLARSRPAAFTSTQPCPVSVSPSPSPRHDAPRHGTSVPGRPNQHSDVERPPHLRLSPSQLAGAWGPGGGRRHAARNSRQPDNIPINVPCRAYYSLLTPPPPPMRSPCFSRPP
jgi:hypothetical protein